MRKVKLELDDDVAYVLGISKDTAAVVELMKPVYGVKDSSGVARLALALAKVAAEHAVFKDGYWQITMLGRDGTPSIIHLSESREDREKEHRQLVDYAAEG